MTTELERLCREHQITATFDPISLPSEGTKRAWEAYPRAWTVTFYRHLPLRPSVTITVAFYSGPLNGEPEMEDVLATVLEEARAEDYVTYESWCDDLGRDPDSIDSQHIYRACLQQSLFVRFLLGFDNALLEQFQKAAEDYHDRDSDDGPDSGGGGGPAPASQQRPSTGPRDSPDGAPAAAPISSGAAVSDDAGIGDHGL